MIPWGEIALFTVGSIFTIVMILYLPAAYVEKRWPFRKKKDKKVNSGAKFG